MSLNINSKKSALLCVRTNPMLASLPLPENLGRDSVTSDDRQKAGRTTCASGYTDLICGSANMCLLFQSKPSGQK